MFTNKRALVAVASGLAVAAALTACSGGGGSSSDGKTLSILAKMAKGTSSGDVFYSEVSKFEKESGIKVKVVSATDDIDSVFETSVAAGQQADIIAINLYDKSTSWLENGVTIPVTEYAKQWGLADKYVGEAKQEWTAPNGELRGFPYSGFSWPILYNTDLLKKAGIDSIPTTTDELIADAGKLRAAGITPWVNGGSDWNGSKLFSQFIQLYTSTDETKKLQSKGGYCASDAAMKGIDDFVKVRDAGVFVDNIQGYTVDMAQSDYFTGKAAIMSNASWMFAEVPDAVLKATNLGGLPLPDGAKATKPTIYQAYTGVGFMLSTKAKDNLDAVEKFVKYMNGEEPNKEFIAKAAALPATDNPSFASAATNPLLKSAIGDLTKQTQVAVLPDLQVPSAASSNVDKAAAQAFGKGVDAQTICKALDSAYAG